MPCHHGERLVSLVGMDQAIEAARSGEEPLVPILGGIDSGIVYDPRDGALWEVTYDEEGLPLRVPAPPLTGLLARIADLYEQRRASIWRRTRLAPTDAPWVQLEAAPARKLASLPIGSAIIRTFSRPRPLSEISVKLSDEGWFSTPCYHARDAVVDEVIAAGCQALRTCLSEGELEPTKASEGVAADITRMIGKQCGEHWQIVQGALRMWVQPSLAALLSRLRPLLATRFPAILLRAGAKPEALDAAEQSLGRPLPAELRALFAFADGQERGSIRWKYRLCSSATSTGQKRKDGVIPFLEDQAGDELGVDSLGSYGPSGAVVHLDHERPETVTVQYENLTTFLECFVDGLEANLYVEWEAGLFPAELVSTGNDSAVRAHDQVRTNGEYPWTRRRTPSL